jgi:hypothetical protein
MTTFNDREKAFENKFAHDAELQFKASARRNKLLGHWAAAILGKTGEDAEEYARAVVIADLQRPGDGDVFDKVWKDLQAAAAPIDEATLRARMEALMAEAKHQIMNETPKQ